jgi:hypothetical protein
MKKVIDLTVEELREIIREEIRNIQTRDNFVDLPPLRPTYYKTDNPNWTKEVWCKSDDETN